MAEVALGSDHAGIRPSAAMSASNRRISSAARSRIVDPELPGLAQDVVVDVGDVADAPGLVAEVAEPALEDVEGQIDLGVPEVGRVVRGDPARVHGDQRRRCEGDDLPLGRVVEPHPLSPVHQVSASAEAGQLDGGVHLVPDVDGDEHRGEGLDGRGLGQAAGIDAAQAVDGTRPAPPSPMWPRRDRSRPGHRPSSGDGQLLHLRGRQVMERGRHQRVRAARPGWTPPPSPGEAAGR